MELARAANRGHYETRNVVIVLKIQKVTRENLMFIFFSPKTKTYRKDVHRHPRLSPVSLYAARAQSKLL